MNKVEPRTLPGFMELYPNQQVVFNNMKKIIEDTYQSYGFYPLDTPVIESSEVLLAKAGGETEKQIYRFNKGDNDFDYVDNLNFNTTLPKIMTYHSAKGLQFDMVILPLYNGASDDEAKKALYVAMTRTMHSLYVLYSTQTLLPPLNVPSYLFSKE